MTDDTVILTVPADPRYARFVRMTAANLAACWDMSVDGIEDVRMVAEEGFIYACAGCPQEITVEMSCKKDSFVLDLSLGEAAVDEGELTLTRALLYALCREFSVDPHARMLHLLLQAPYADTQ